MYKKTDPQQTLFGVKTHLSASLRMRLEDSWAQLFRTEVLPILLKSEDRYSILYGTTGRPNFSVARMLGLCLLQELCNLSDQQALDTFGFDIRWRYALDVSDQDAYLSRRSLVEFRRRLVAKDPDMAVVRTIFENISKAAIKKLGISTSEQRVDSTHIVSNICTRGRLDLFQKTIDLFIKSLDKKQFARIPRHIKKWHQRESGGWFGMGQVQRTAKLKELAKYLYELIALFKNDQQVTVGEPYQLLVRLFNEQCETIEKFDLDATRPSNNKQIKVKKKTQGETLQSPHDPDASFGHKGKGYSAHITETCNNKGKNEIITDYEVHGAARSDAGKAADVIHRLESAGLKPETLFADGGYPSVPSTLEIVKGNVEFLAPVNRSSLPEDIIGRDQFKFDKDGFVLQCPAQNGPTDHRMRSANNKKGSSLHAIFDGDTCRACSKLDLCPVRAPNKRQRGCKPRDTTGDFRLEVTPQLVLRDQMYADQQSDQWKQRYKIRSGIEATMSELKRSHGMGKLRVRRAAKVCFAVACEVIACNIKRWAKAYVGSCNGLQCVLKLILDQFGVLEATAEEIYRYLQANRSWQLKLVA
jgi:hypothetical protein